VTDRLYLLRRCALPAAFIVSRHQPYDALHPPDPLHTPLRRPFHLINHVAVGDTDATSHSHPRAPVRKWFFRIRVGLAVVDACDDS